ncbi:hypothetical protein [Tardiphaga sp.]|uniref:hypothetical protein n=1 Tax=Tardiphaga sp. TaxID=1926292 RepID=UPI0037DA5EEF
MAIGWVGERGICKACGGDGRCAFLYGTKSSVLSRKGSTLNKPESAIETQLEKRARVARDGKVAMDEHAARVAFVANNTEKLRALRLAKEAADRAEALANPPPPKVKRIRKAKTAA